MSSCLRRESTGGRGVLAPVLAKRDTDYSRLRPASIICITELGIACQYAPVDRANGGDDLAVVVPRVLRRIRGISRLGQARGRSAADRLKRSDSLGHSGLACIMISVAAAVERDTPGAAVHQKMGVGRLADRSRPKT